jgi:hypothetical protein
MSFGQVSGPPASARQVDELLGLLRDAGHDGFREARYPMGFTQRQAAGKFTVAEADALIQSLQAAADHRPALTPSTVAATRPSKAQEALRRVSDEDLAAELQRRGWIVVEP